ncbi:MAG: dihydroorotate dehydrogenase-like protein [Bacteroidales bacterium]
MGKLSTNYLGLPVGSPVIVGASDLTENPDHLVQMEKAGAGAIVFKSLFEEQVQLEEIRLGHQLESYNDRHAEMTSVFPDTVYSGPEQYLDSLVKARQLVKIPLIGSLNAVYEKTWVHYAKLIEQTGVDGLELNFFNVPFSGESSSAEVEAGQIAIIRKVVEAVGIPVSVKLSPYYSNLLHFIGELNKTGIKGIVLFNQLFQPDIDIDTLKHISPWNLSTKKDYRLSLRFAGLLFGESSSEIIASRGIHGGEEAVRLLLAGAGSLQVVSTLYKNGIDQITRINEFISGWMSVHKFDHLEDFRGQLSKAKTLNPMVYKRAQYIDMMLNSGKLLAGMEP